MNRGLLAVVIATVILLAAAAFAFASFPAPDAADSLTKAPSGPRAFEGFCEASAILPWEGGFLVGDNETEGAVYRLDAAFEPGEALVLSSEVEDIEALTVGPAGELIVVGSQSANKNGKLRPDRERVLVQGHAPIRPDLTGCPACMSARGLPPKQGGLSVEGAAWWEGALWLGVRSPLVGGEALLLRLEGQPTEALAVAETTTVGLGGYGIRDLIVTPEGLYLLAGPADGRKSAHRLYRLAEPGGRPELVPVDLPAGSEGLVWDGDGLVVVIDGDGKPGEPCKEPATWVRLPMTGARSRSMSP